MVKEQQELNIGVLDIYGFEIFQVSSPVPNTGDSTSPQSINDAELWGLNSLKTEDQTGL